MLKLVYRLDVLGSVAGLAKTWTQPVEITPAQTQTEFFFFEKPEATSPRPVVIMSYNSI